MLEIRERTEWERVRWLACVMMQPHKKQGAKLTPTDLVKFEWEKKVVEVDVEQQRKAAEYAKKKYEKLKDNG